MSRVAKVRERVLALRQASPELPAHKIAKAIGVRVAMVRRVLGEPTPPRPAHQGPQVRETFTWGRAGKGCDKLAERLGQFHSLTEAA
jgi:hypothetical protein